MIDALLPKVRRDILALLFGRPDEAFYQREIVRATGGGKGAVERELRSLVKAGILLREKRGNLMKRSLSVYERAGIVTSTEAEAALAAARRLRDRLSAWLAAEHPGLSPPSRYR
jgi:DNA-binding transcriptional ArsR family regulator